MKALVFLLALTLSAPAFTQRRQATCLNYEPAMVTLTGTIKPRTFAGPPNYESIKKGDAREDVWLLQLTKPICMSASGDAEAEKNVTNLQLVFSEGEQQYKQYRALKDRRVTVTGTLFHQTTGHHHTKVLLTVTRIKKS